MQFKPIAAIIVLLLVVASLLVAGCTTTKNQASETSGHALVQALHDYDNRVSSYAPRESLEWLNDTTAHAHYVTNLGTSIRTVDITYAAFPNVTAASAYFDSLRSQYPTKTDGVPHDISIKSVTGDAPTVYKATRSDYDHYLTQEDTVVMQLSFKHESTNRA